MGKSRNCSSSSLSLHCFFLFTKKELLSTTWRGERSKKDKAMSYGSKNTQSQTSVVPFETECFSIPNTFPVAQKSFRCPMTNLLHRCDSNFVFLFLHVAGWERSRESIKKKKKEFNWFLQNLDVVSNPKHSTHAVVGTLGLE